MSNIGPTSPAVTVTEVTVSGDYNGNGTTDVAVVRRTNANLLQWYVQGSGNTLLPLNFGAGSLDVPVPGDYNGDGKTDPAVYRPSTATWYIATSPGYVTKTTGIKFGWAGVDIPVPADYNGLGDAQIAVYRPTTGQWFVKGSANPVVVTAGQPGDIPVPGNYDNTGNDEFAIFRPSTAQWVILGPTGVYSVTLGQAGDIPVPGALRRDGHQPGDRGSRLQPDHRPVHHPGPDRLTDHPVPARAISPCRVTTTVSVSPKPPSTVPSTAQWFVVIPGSTTPTLFNYFGWANHDIPAGAPYAYRALKGSTLDASGTPSGPVIASVTPVTTTTTTTTASSLTPPPACAPTAVVRIRPRQAHTAKKAHKPSHTLAKHPIASTHRIPVKAAAIKKV